MRRKEAYSTFDGKHLDYFIIEPDLEKREKVWPGVVFFFGGGWTTGTPEQFIPQAEEFAQHGYIVFLPDYRTFQSDGISIDVCLKDAFFFLKQVDQEAKRLGLDKDNLFLAGGSAGGHLALSSVLINKVFHELKIKGVFLYNPAVDLTIEALSQMPVYQALAFEPVSFSPLHILKATRERPKEIPPLLVFHGTEDQVVPFERVICFQEEVIAQGGTCEVVPYEGRKHGFFNQREGNRYEDYEDTLKRAVAFCQKHERKE